LRFITAVRARDGCIAEENGATAAQVNPLVRPA